MSETDRMHLLRVLSTDDLYFLLARILSTSSWPHPSGGKLLWDDEWILDRCRECQFDNQNVVKIWARGHGKSTIDTFGGLIRLALADPNTTIGIFSITAKVARSFLYQIKLELEQNELLKALHPDKLYLDPQARTNGSPKWSLNDGITIKRSRNWKNATIEAHGLVDGNFTGARFKVRHFDDMVNESTVNNPEMIEKAVRGYSLAQACRAPNGWTQVVGTFYSQNDPYIHLCKKLGYNYSIHACHPILWDDVEIDDETGFPKKLYHDFSKTVFFSEKEISEAKRDVGEEFGIQYLCDPTYALEANFDESWIEYYDAFPGNVRKGQSVYILVDPANEKKKHSDYTCMWVVGLGDDQNYYILDCVRAKLNLSERTDKLFELVSRWGPLQVRYEQYGLMSDIQHIKYVMDHRNYHFNIEKVGGSTKKTDRIKRLLPPFKNHKFYFPKALLQTNADGKEEDMVKTFIAEEYREFPQAQFDDMMDSLSRIMEPDMPLHWPRVSDRLLREGDCYTIASKLRDQRDQSAATWMGA